MQKTLFIGLVVAFVALHAFLKQRGPDVAPGTSAVPLLTGLRAPQAAEIARIAGESRLTVVTFFETWCGPCRQELPELAKLYDRRRAEGLAVVGVYGPSSQDVDAFRTQLGVTFPTLSDEGAALASVWGVDSVPTSVVLDARLQVVTVARGYQPSFVTRVSALVDGGPTP